MPAGDVPSQVRRGSHSPGDRRHTASSSLDGNVGTTQIRDDRQATREEARMATQETSETLVIPPAQVVKSDPAIGAMSHPSFWATLPGLLTAFGTAVGAIGALVTVLNTVGVLPGQSTVPRTAAATVTVVPRTAASPIVVLTSTPIRTTNGSALQAAEALVKSKGYTPSPVSPDGYERYKLRVLVATGPGPGD